MVYILIFVFLKSAITRLKGKTSAKSVYLARILVKILYYYRKTIWAMW